MILAASSCTIQRDVPIDRFACESGGPCDGGQTPKDAGVRPDAGEPPDGGVDAGVADSGEMLPACPGVLALPADGLVRGDTNAELNKIEVPCSIPGGKDVVYGFVTQGALSFLDVSLEGSDFDTSMHVYRTDCTGPNLIACNEDDENWARGLIVSSAVHLVGLPAGSYAIVIDAYGNVAGSYVLSVTGGVAPGERCDPSKEYLRCEIGACAPDVLGDLRCPRVLDCMDGVDADEDGTLDEDGKSCTVAPAVTCADPLDPIVNFSTNLSATIFDDGTILHRRWSVTERPIGSVDVPAMPNQEATFFRPDLMGPYRLRFRAADNNHQLSACEIDLSPTLPDRLRVEAYWNAEVPQHDQSAGMLLHLLHPTATAWLDPILDCFGGCFMRDWGQAMDQTDDPFLYGLYYSPQLVSVAVPQQNGSYGIGISHEFFGYRQSMVTVLLFCDGLLEQTFGPVTLSNGMGLAADNDFWKVAEVSFDAAGCNVVPYANPDPVIVRGRDAMMAR